MSRGLGAGHHTDCVEVSRGSGGVLGIIQTVGRSTGAQRGAGHHTDCGEVNRVSRG